MVRSCPDKLCRARLVGHTSVSQRRPPIIDQRSAQVIQDHSPLPHHPTTHLTADTMITPRPTAALRAANAISTSTRAAATSQARSFTTSKPQRAADHGAHEDHYDPPTGWLWGLDPSKKHEKEGWENIFFYGFFGSLGLGVVAYAFKPDTS